jgi:iron complex transport system ATP-binding protein
MIKKGQLVDDGKKEEILTNSKLTSLFDWPIKVIKENGYYQAIPG